MRSGYYRLYARGLAAHGYVVAQYDLPVTKYVQDRDEAALAPHILRWLQDLTADTESREGLHGLLDTSRVGVAGHSRGAKLATLVYAGKSSLWALLMLLTSSICQQPCSAASAPLHACTALHAAAVCRQP